MNDPYHALIQDTHKEDQKSRIATDAGDRPNIRQRVNRSIDPLSTSNEADKRVNVVSGRVAHVPVSVDRTLAIGPNQMK